MFQSKEISDLSYAACLLCQLSDALTFCLVTCVCKERKAVLFWPAKVPPLIFLFTVTLFFREDLGSQQKCGESTKISHVPPRCIGSHIISIPHQRGTFIITDDTVLTHHNHSLHYGSLHDIIYCIDLDKCIIWFTS